MVEKGEAPDAVSETATKTFAGSFPLINHL